MNRLLVSLQVLGFLLAVVASGWAAEPNPEESQAVTGIKKLGGRVTVDEKSPAQPVIGVDLGFTAVTDAGLAHLKGLTQLRKVRLLLPQRDGCRAGTASKADATPGAEPDRHKGDGRRAGTPQRLDATRRSVPPGHQGQRRRAEAVQGLTQLQVLGSDLHGSHGCWLGASQGLNQGSSSWTWPRSMRR